MGIKTGIFKRIFNRAATVSLSLVLAGPFIAAPPVAAERHYNTYGSEQGDTQIYKDPELASDSTAPVGAHLVLAMDASGSMTKEEFAIQLQATAQALNSELFRSVIKYKSGDNSVAIAVVEFDNRAHIRVPWVDIRGDEINDKPYQPNEKRSSAAPDKLDQLALKIRTLSRILGLGTEFEPMMDVSRTLFLNAPWPATERRILDVFSDGEEWGFKNKRERLIDLGVTINAFAILNEEPDLDRQYREGFNRLYAPLITKTYQRGADGIYSQPGRVWAVARNMKAKGNDALELKSFFGEVARGMTQKLSIEVAGVHNYHRALAFLGQKPDFPTPRKG